MTNIFIFAPSVFGLEEQPGKNNKPNSYTLSQENKKLLERIKNQNDLAALWVQHDDMDYRYDIQFSTELRTYFSKIICEQEGSELEIPQLNTIKFLANKEKKKNTTNPQKIKNFFVYKSIEDLMLALAPLSELEERVTPVYIANGQKENTKIYDSEINDIIQFSSLSSLVDHYSPQETISPEIRKKQGLIESLLLKPIF